MSRPSRLGLALAATVAASTLFAGGGAAFAVPGPDSAECKTAKAEEATAKTAAESGTATAEQQTAYEQAKTKTTTACTAPPATGDKGQPGDKGATGDKGAPGDKGPTGDKGTTGDKGAPGDKGPTGDKGTTGDRGEQGKRGEQGERGEQGPPGPATLIVIPIFLDGRDAKDIDCDDFPNQPAAQAYFDDDRSDPARLDADDDDEACESLADLKGAKIAQVSDRDLDKTTDDGSEVNGEQVSEVPEGSVDTGGFQ